MKEIRIKEKTVKREISNLILMTAIVPIIVLSISNFYSLIKDAKKVTDTIVKGSAGIIDEALLGDHFNSGENIEYLSIDANAKGIKENKNSESVWLEKTLQNYIKVNEDVDSAYMGSEDKKFILAPSRCWK